MRWSFIIWRMSCIIYILIMMISGYCVFYLELIIILRIRIYFIIMIIASFQYRVPAEGWAPKGYKPPSPEESAAKMKTLDNVHINQAIKTPQFYQLWIVYLFLMFVYMFLELLLSALLHLSRLL